MRYVWIAIAVVVAYLLYTRLVNANRLPYPPGGNWWPGLRGRY